MGMESWSTNPTENVSLGGYALSLSDRAPLAQLMADVKAGVDDGISSAAEIASNVMAYVPDMLRQQTERLTGGRNTVIYDCSGNPHVMVVVPRFCIEDVLYGSGGSTVHPAFSIGGRTVPEILIGKYQAGGTAGGLPVTQARQRPMVNVSLGSALLSARALGDGWSVVTNAEYAARAMQVQKACGSDHAPRGNTEWGRSKDCPWETGALTVSSYWPGNSSLGSDGITLTGTGPLAWTDDGTPEGVADIAGNVLEWAPGAALTSSGRLLVIPDNDAHLPNWMPSEYAQKAKYIKSDGAFVTSSAGTLLLCASADGAQPYIGTVKGAASLGSGTFAGITGSGSLAIPDILVALGLAPGTIGAAGRVYAAFISGRHAVRGGCYVHSTMSGYIGPICGDPGLWNLWLGPAYSAAAPHIGYRLSYIPALGSA